MNTLDMIIDEHGQKIYKYCYNMLRSKQEAEDAVQEIFIKAYKNIDQINEVTSVAAWLYKVAYNHCLNIIRKKKLLSFLPFNEDLKTGMTYLQPAVEKNVFSEELTNTISRLSPQDRSVLILRVIEEKSYEEIAAIFNKQPDAVRKQYERARKKIKGYLETEKGVRASEKISIL